MHALKAVPEEDGGRGKKGGLSEYARRIGKDKGNLSRYRDAARVVCMLNRCIDTTVLIDKAQHLAEVATADAALWPTLVAHMLKGWPLSELWQKSVSGRQNSDKPVDARKGCAEFCTG
jgi:hypothetical protein